MPLTIVKWTRVVSLPSVTTVFEIQERVKDPPLRVRQQRYFGVSK